MYFLPCESTQYQPWTLSTASTLWVETKWHGSWVIFKVSHILYSVQDLSSIVAAMTPCNRLYAFVGSTLKKDLISADHRYADWIEFYGGTDFQKSADDVELILDSLVQDDRQDGETVLPYHSCCKCDVPATLETLLYILLQERAYRSVCYTSWVHVDQVSKNVGFVLQHFALMSWE